MNNGVIVYDGLTPGSSAHLMCNEGYTTSEVTRDRICLNSGVWSDRMQICEEIGKLIICWLLIKDSFAYSLSDYH